MKKETISPGTRGIKPEFREIVSFCIPRIKQLSLLLVLPAYHGSLSERRIKDFLPDPKALRRNLQKLIGVDEVQTLLQTHLLRRRKL